jgi:hypothetical protein
MLKKLPKDDEQLSRVLKPTLHPSPVPAVSGALNPNAPLDVLLRLKRLPLVSL